MPRWISVLLFVLVTTSLQLLIHHYLWRRLVRDTGMPHPWRRVMTVSLVLFAVSMPLMMWVSRQLDAAAGRTAGWPVFLWMGFSLLLLGGFLLVDTLRLFRWSVRHGISRAGAGRAPAAQVSAPADPGRRQFFARVAGGAVVTAATGAMGMGVRAARGTIPIKEVPVVLARLPPALDGFAIVQLTDIHVGYTISRAFVQDLVEQANAARPDLIAITGDLVDGDVPTLAHAVAPLADLRAPHGVYFVTGNHEYYSGVDSWLTELRRLGIRVLRNERVRIGADDASFDLAGIDDHQAVQFGNGHGADLDRALAGRAPGDEVVLLAHQPRQVHDAVRHGVGLQLSGHTHGGQIWPWHYLARAQQGGLLAGLSRHGDNTQLYISRGTGYWGPPMRLGAPAEIARVVLRAPRA